MRSSSADSRTLEQVEDNAWPRPSAESTRLEKMVHELRTKPLNQLRVEDLRVLLSQQVGVETVIPIALAELESNPLAEGDLYPGDLLSTILRVDPMFWKAHDALLMRVRSVLERVRDLGDLSAYGAPHSDIWSRIDEFSSGL